MQDKVVLPVALQIVTDDIGWFYGRDTRCSEGPSRTGLPRRHVAEDYAAIDAVGKAIGMKINCPMVIGEWDKKNRLRGMPHATNDEKGWHIHTYRRQWQHIALRWHTSDKRPSQSRSLRHAR